MKHLLIFTAIFQLASCRSLYDRTNYVKSSATGEISEQEWKYAYAYTDAEAKKPDGIEHIIVLTTTKTKNACPTSEEAPNERRELILGIDGKLGEMIIGGKAGQHESAEDLFTYSKQQRKATAAFFDSTKKGLDQYRFAASGKIKVTKITSTLIEGFVLVKDSPQNYANGRFKAKICKWGQLN